MMSGFVLVTIAINKVMAVRSSEGLTIMYIVVIRVCAINFGLKLIALGVVGGRGNVVYVSLGACIRQFVWVPIGGTFAKKVVLYVEVRAQRSRTWRVVQQVPVAQL